MPQRQRQRKAVAMPIFNYAYRKIGGLHFLRLGRFQFMFCLCSPERTAAYFDNLEHARFIDDMVTPCS
jgi:hypothetical protein